MATPSTEGDVSLITVKLHYGGKFVGGSFGSTRYVDGKSLTYDFLDIKGDVSMKRLLECCSELGLCGEKIFYTIEKDTVKPLLNDKELFACASECEDSKVMEIFVEVTDEVVEVQDFEENGGTVDEEGFEFEESDYQSKEDSSDDEVNEVPKKNNEKTKLVAGDSDEEDSGDEDVCDDGDDFDETRVSDDESPVEVFPRFNSDVIYTPEFVLGMRFENKQLFKKAVTSHAINTRRSLYFKKNDKIRVHARCRGDGCNWACNALKLRDEETFQIRFYNTNHKCAPTFHVTNMSSTWLGQKHLSEFQCDPKRNMKGWRKEVMKKLNVSVSNQQAYRARKVALKVIEGVPDQQYNKLWDYAQELRSSNPGSTVIVDIDDEGKFYQMYVCFEAVKRGFLSGCRPFIGVDGCWLKGPRGGILLSAVGVDPGNAIYPIAYAIVSVENKESWEWFLICLKNDLKILPEQSYTFMSDKQKGLILAMRDVFPGVEHRHCVRHMHNNMVSAGFRGLAYKDAIWKAARASTVGVFNERMREIAKMNEGKAAEWLADKDPCQWSKSHFSVKSKCDMLLNNVCESFNSCILDARDKPILTMLEWIRQWLMERFKCNRDRATLKWKGLLPPKITQTLRKNMDAMNDCIPMKSNNRFYQIQCSDGSLFAVDLEEMTCSCRLWDLSGIPCKHALSAIVNQGCDPEKFVDECYSMETYRKVYAPALMPIVGEVDWASTLYIPPLPPNFGKKRGRPTKLRRMNPNEKGQKRIVKMKRQQGTKKCSRCGLVGHTVKKCSTPAPAPTTQDPTATAPVAPVDLPEEMDVHSTAPTPTASQAYATTTEPTPLAPTDILAEIDLPAPPKKMKVRRAPLKMKAPIGISQEVRRGRGRGRGRGRSQGEFTLRVNMVGASHANVAPVRSLMDEDETDFEAALSQANTGWMDAPTPLMHGPTPWEQLMGTSSPTLPLPHPNPNYSYGGLRPVFCRKPMKHLN